MFKKAFTMMEIVTVLAIIAIVAGVTISVTRNKLNKVDAISYYAAYDTVRDIAANIVAQTEYNYTASQILADPTSVTAASATDLCKAIKNDYNISKSDCDTTAAQMKSNTSTSFKDVTPHIRLSNGMNIYITSDLGKVTELDDAQDINDHVGFLINIDLNGNKGKGILYQDVFPFYILMSGKILPLYNSSEAGGANNVQALSGNILYDDYSTDKRVVKVSRTGLDFQTGACATEYIKSQKYCKGIQPDTHCANEDSDCRYIVNEPINIFGK